MSNDMWPEKETKNKVVEIDGLKFELEPVDTGASKFVLKPVQTQVKDHYSLLFGNSTRVLLISEFDDLTVETAQAMAEAFRGLIEYIQGSNKLYADKNYINRADKARGLYLTEEGDK